MNRDLTSTKSVRENELRSVVQGETSSNAMFNLQQHTIITCLALSSPLSYHILI